jgi:hypothetical protein
MSGWGIAMPWSTTTPVASSNMDNDVESQTPAYASHYPRGAPPPTFPPRKKIVPINRPPTLYTQTRRDNYSNRPPTSFAPVNTNAQYAESDKNQMDQMEKEGLTFGGRGGKRRSTKRMFGGKRRSTKRRSTKRRSTKRRSTKRR